MPHAVAYTLGPGVVRGRDVVLVGGSERPDYCRIHKGRVQMLVVYNVTLFARQIRTTEAKRRALVTELERAGQKTAAPRGQAIER